MGECSPIYRRAALMAALASAGGWLCRVWSDNLGPVNSVTGLFITGLFIFVWYLWMPFGISGLLFVAVGALVDLRTGAARPGVADALLLLLALGWAGTITVVVLQEGTIVIVAAVMLGVRLLWRLR